ncbi:MAG: hypothetical protein AABW86_05195 [Candidatus Micrarchaeota archaeon]
MATLKFADDRLRNPGSGPVTGNQRYCTVLSPLRDELEAPIFTRPFASPSDLEISGLRTMFRHPTSAVIKEAFSKWKANPDRSIRAEIENLLFAAAISIKNNIFVRLGAVHVLAKTGCCTDDLRRVAKSLENSEHPGDIRVRVAAIKKVSQ